MELTDHFAVRRGWNAARSKEFTVVPPAYTVTPGVQLCYVASRANDLSVASKFHVTVSTGCSKRRFQ